MKVSAVVISHEQPQELERCLTALEPQIDELLVVANTPRSVGTLPVGVRQGGQLESARLLGEREHRNP